MSHGSKRPSTQKTAVETSTNENHPGMKTGMKAGMKTADAILCMIEENPTISIDMLSQNLAKARSTIQESIVKLKSVGVIRRVGPDKGGHWEIVKLP